MLASRSEPNKTPPSWLWVLALFLVPCLLVATHTPAASASPSTVTKGQISQAQDEASALKQRVQKLNTQAEVLIEKYDTANTKLADTQAQVSSTQKKLAQAEKDLDAARTVLGARLAQIYRQGETGMLDVLLSSNSFSDLINRVFLLGQLSKEDKQVVDQVMAYQKQVSTQEKELNTRLANQKKQAAEVAQTKKAVLKQLASNQQALKEQQQQVAALESTYQAQQAELAAEARAAAQAAAQKAAEQAAARKASTQGSAKSSAPAAPVGTSGKGSQAVAIAMNYLGVPYVWAGSSPSGFDCSGLVMYVYAKLGVGLPHSSALQYNCGAHVSRGQLEPGDLVFFGSPIHHVGIYVGNGNMINAPYPGVRVRIDRLQSDYAGATRLF
jgi:peptidoglycan DL-endopeptidase CwlO